MLKVITNTANLRNKSTWGNIIGNITTVGTNGPPSSYNIYDMTGNVSEILSNERYSDFFVLNNDYQFPVAGITTESLESSISFPMSYTTNNASAGVGGFRVSSVTNPFNFSNFTKIGDINNFYDSDYAINNDNIQIGSVSYEYFMSKFQTTVSQYVEFLNAVALTDTYALYIGTNIGSFIARIGSSGSYSYSARANYANKPIDKLGWFQCARYCNWLHNNKPIGPQNSTTTETGAYSLNGQNPRNVLKNNDARYYLPTIDEWYKAAFYKGNGTNSGYWKYATQSDSAPVDIYANNVGDGTVPIKTKIGQATTLPVLGNLGIPLIVTGAALTIGRSTTGNHIYVAQGFRSSSNTNMNLSLRKIKLDLTPRFEGSIAKWDDFSPSVELWSSSGIGSSANPNVFLSSFSMVPVDTNSIDYIYTYTFVGQYELSQNTDYWIVVTNNTTKINSAIRWNFGEIIDGVQSRAIALNNSGYLNIGMRRRINNDNWIIQPIDFDLLIELEASARFAKIKK